MPRSRLRVRGPGRPARWIFETNEDSDKVDEKFTVQLATGDTDWPSGFGAGTPSSVAITITDNDKPELELSQSATSVNEGGTLTDIFCEVDQGAEC